MKLSGVHRSSRGRREVSRQSRPLPSLLPDYRTGISIRAKLPGVAELTAATILRIIRWTIRHLLRLRTTIAIFRPFEVLLKSDVIVSGNQDFKSGTFGSREKISVRKSFPPLLLSRPNGMLRKIVGNRRGRAL